MDERFIYLLNGLISRQYQIGRIARFRQVARGRQAAAYEILTAESHELTVWLYPPAFTADALARVGGVLGKLAEQHFLVVPWITNTQGAWVSEGPQGQGLVVGVNPAGRAVDLEEWTTPALSLLGLRIAWLHNLLPAVGLADEATLADRLAVLLDRVGAPRLNPLHLGALRAAVEGIPPAIGWLHGDLSPAAVLLDDEKQVRCFVDIGLIGTGDPLEDLIDVYLNWCAAPDGMVDAHKLRVVLEGYRSLRPVGPARRDVQKTWLTAVHNWLARRILNAGMGVRALPKRFGRLLESPQAVADAMLLCEPK